MRPALLILTLLTFGPATALGQDAPLPRPLYDRGPAPSAEPSEQARTETSTSTFSWNQIQPNVGFGMTMSMTDTDFAKPGFGLWGGVKFLPWIDTWSPFGSLRLRVDNWQDAQGKPRDVLVVARAGASWIQRPKKRYLSVMMAYMDVYGILGAKLFDMNGDKSRAGTIRAGVGIGAPVFIPGSLFMALNGVPLPNSVELIFDVKPETGDVNAMISLGIGL